MAINQVSISGNVTRDAELRQTGGGNAVLTFSVAVNERHKNTATGQWEDRPNYFDCVMFGSRAEKLQRYITKGTKLAVGGRLHWRSWEAQDGSKRSKVDIYADEVEFMSRADNTQQVAYSAPSPQMNQGGGNVGLYDSDIPF